MDLSETILAAMIGGFATVSTALFQLFTAFKSSYKADPKVKRRSTLRSLLSIMALMVASAVGGFLYSEFLEQRGVEDMRAMRDELREVKELAAMAAGRFSAPASVPAGDATDSAAPGALQISAAVAAVPAAAEGRAEAVVYVPACRPMVTGEGMTECGEAEAQRVALCGTVPTIARVETLELFAQPDAIQHPWEQHAAVLEQDLGGARFTGNSFEYAQSVEQKAVCVNFMQWSSAHPHLARLVVRYDLDAGKAADVTAPLTTESPPLPVIAIDSAVLVPQSASFIAPGPAASQ